ncbi:unnamed protein product [Ixodes hexagonus]
MITHACVRYEDDHSQATVPVSYIKDFKPNGPSDFDERAKYSVRWTYGDGDSDDDDQENYYKARILLLGVSNEDVAAKMSRKRIRIKKILNSDSSEDEVPERKQEVEKQEKKQMKERQETSGRTSLLRLLEQKKKKINSANLEHHMERQVERQGQEELESRHAKAKRCINSLEKQLAKKEEELAKVRRLNMRLQDQLLKKIEGKKTSELGSNQKYSEILYKKKTSQIPFLNLTKNELRKLTFHELLSQVNLGRGIFLASKTWVDVQERERRAPSS